MENSKLFSTLWFLWLLKIKERSRPTTVSTVKYKRDFRAHLHQVSVSTLQQLCDDTSDAVLIENNGVTSEWGCNPFSSVSIVFSENSIL